MTEAQAVSSTKTPQVFLSHATRDAPVVAWVGAQVEAMGIRAYIAEHDPQPGTPLAAKVRAAIQESDAMLALLTHAGDASRYVQQEIGAALQAGKPVIALVDQRVPQNGLAMLEGVEHMAFDPEDPAPSAASLTAALRALSERRHLPPPPQVTVRTQPALQVQLTAELHLDGSQLLVGLLMLSAIAGLVYLATQTGGEFGPA